MIQLACRPHYNPWNICQTIGGQTVMASVRHVEPRGIGPRTVSDEPGECRRDRQPPEDPMTEDEETEMADGREFFRTRYLAAQWRAREERMARLEAKLCRLGIDPDDLAEWVKWCNQP